MPGLMRKSVSKHDRFDAMQPEPAPGMTLKTIVLCAAGWVVGYLISSISSVLFFVIGHIPPHQPASTGIMWATAIYGTVFAAIAAAVGASFSRKNALGIGAAIALTIGVTGMVSWYLSPNRWNCCSAAKCLRPHTG